MASTKEDLLPKIPTLKSDGSNWLTFKRARPRSSLVPVITARRKATKPKTAGRKEVVRLDSVPRGSGSQKGRVARTRLQLLMLMVANLMEFGSQTQPPQMMKMTGSEKLTRRLFSPV